MWFSHGRYMTPDQRSPTNAHFRPPTPESRVTGHLHQSLFVGSVSRRARLTDVSKPDPTRTSRWLGHFSGDVTHKPLIVHGTGGWRRDIAMSFSLLESRRRSKVKHCKLELRLAFKRHRIGPCLTTFRINTCKSVSKQSTLTTFRINTCEKPRGRGACRKVRCYLFSPL